MDMMWVMFVSLGLIVMGMAVVCATNLRDQLQVNLTHRRKLKETGTPQGNRILLILLLPITLYLVLGTLLLLLLSILEIASEKLRHYAGSDHIETIAWHQVNPVLTLLFPLTWPLIALMDILVFIGAVVSAVWKTIQKVLNGVLRFARRLWIVVIRLVEALITWISDRIRGIWVLIIDGTRAIWEMVTDKTQQVFEQITSLIQQIWGTISTKMRI
jgi:phage-related protein